MQRVAVFATGLVVAAALVGLLVLNRRGPATIATPLLASTASDVTSIRVLRPDGAEETVRWDGFRACWVVELSAEDGATTWWPASEERVRAALRLIHDMDAQGMAADQSGPAESATLVWLERRDGTVATMRLGPRPLGGLVPVEVTDTAGPVGARALVAHADLYELFAEGRLRQWRDRSALSGLGPDLSRIELRRGSREVVLWRAGGRWRLISPVEAQADHDAVAQVVRALRAVRVATFLDQPVDEASAVGLARPDAFVAVETGRRLAVEGGTRLVVRRQELAIGASARAESAERYARLNEIWIAEGQREPSPTPAPDLIVDATSLAELTLDPAALIDPIACQVLGGDVGRVELTVPPGADQTGRAVTFERTIDGWRDATTAEPVAGEGLEALLALLTRTRARVIEAEGSLAGDMRARVVLLTRGGEPLAAFELSVQGDRADQSTTVVDVRAGRVVRRYGGESAAVVAEWLGEESARR